MARPMDFPYSAAELEKRVDEYFDKCADKKRKPTVHGLCLALEITPYKYEKILKTLRSGEKYKEFQLAHARIVQRAQMRLCDELQQLKDPMSIFQLKQPVYANFKDKPETEINNNIKVTVQLEGMKKGENPFK